MQLLTVFYQLTLGDFRERTRRYSFLLTLLGTFFFGFLVITGKWALRLGDYRGEYNSAWVGSLMASACTTMLGIIGFYLIKNTLSRDRQTRVGEILAASTLSKRLYIASKFVSNYMVLAVMATALAAAAIFMQVIGAEKNGFDLWALMAPFLFICLPALTLVAAAGVLFETTRKLSGTFGNVLYFILAELVLVSSLILDIPILDFAGMSMFIPSMQEAALEAYPGAELGFEMGFVGIEPGNEKATMNLFHWDGINWSLSMLPLRLLWLGLAIFMAGLASVFFDRFDPAGAKRIRRGKNKKSPPPIDEPERQGTTPSGRWSEIGPAVFNFSFWRMWRAETTLMIKGFHWSWYLVAIGLLVAQVAVPYEYARAYVLPVAWIWPLAMWSSMGTRETRFNTGQIIFSSPYPVWRQLPAVWVAGLMLALMTGSGMIMRAFLAGETEHLAALFVGLFFVPTLALFLGVTSGSKKVFEVTYLLIWYIGAINHLPHLDFLGSTNTALSSGMPRIYLLISCMLLFTTFLIRHRQLSKGFS